MKKILTLVALIATIGSVSAFTKLDRFGGSQVVTNYELYTKLTRDVTNKVALRQTAVNDLKEAKDKLSRLKEDLCPRQRFVRINKDNEVKCKPLKVVKSGANKGGVK